MNTNGYSITFYSGKKKKSNGHTTVAILVDDNTGNEYRGTAHCNPQDTYNLEVGLKISEARARRNWFKSEAREAKEQYEIAKKRMECAKHYADLKMRRYIREDKWLNNYIKSV